MGGKGGQETTTFCWVRSTPRISSLFLGACGKSGIGQSAKQEQQQNAKCGGLSTPQRTMKLSVAPVEMTGCFWGKWSKLFT
jgi:hypothetical protein